MGLKNMMKAANKGIRELDAERLVDKFIDLNLTPLGEVVVRTKVKVCGEV